VFHQVRRKLLVVDWLIFFVQFCFYEVELLFLDEVYYSFLFHYDLNHIHRHRHQKMLYDLIAFDLPKSDILKIKKFKNFEKMIILYNLY
jgi:hypothetical protein